jgi:fructose-1-phosphate kinase PfkB-like protein
VRLELEATLAHVDLYLPNLDEARGLLGYVVAPAPPIEVADTVGAGDTFNAALLAGLRDRLPWREAVALAVEVASRAIASSPRRFPEWGSVRAHGR